MGLLKTSSQIKKAEEKKSNLIKGTKGTNNLIIAVNREGTLLIKTLIPATYRVCSQIVIPARNVAAI